MTTGNKAPVWFWIVAILLLPWEAMGCYACVTQIRLGAEAMGPVDDWSLKYFVMFGYAFVATDLIAHKGLAQVLPFPLFIAAVGAFSIWLAGFAARKGWGVG